MTARRSGQTSGSSSGKALQHVRIELAARTAEADWLKQHYERYLRDAYAEIAVLRSAAVPAAALRNTDLEAEVERLRIETQRMRLGEQRYLDRIAELKERLAAVQPQGGAET